jgi:flagellar motor switch protein FliM
MSGHVLSPAAVAALVDAAKEGRLPPEEESSTTRRRARVRTVDFSRPTKFSPDQERRFKRSLDTFCRTASTRVSAELRVPLELEVLSVAQLTWANAHAQVPPKSLAGIVDTLPLGTTLLMTAERHLVMNAIDLLLGANGDDPVVERRMTDIDWALSRHFLERLLEQLSVIWNDMAEVELTISAVDAHMETAQMAPVSEPTLVLTMEARLEGNSSVLSLLIPHHSIAAVAHRFSAREDDHSTGDDDGHHDRLRRAVGRVDMTVRAEVAAVELPLEQVLALRPGDVLPLDAPASAGVTLYADQTPVLVCKPGRSGSRRAVQVIGDVGRQA